MRKVFSKLRYLKLDDVICVIMFFIAMIPAIYIHITKKRIWLFAERPSYADDNAITLYRWIRENHSDENVFFVIGKNARAYDNRDKNMIKWKSLRHYVYFLAADLHITSMFNSDRMNNRVCDYLEYYLLKKQNRVYIRHGIHKDGLEMHKYSVLKVRLFICGAKPEYEFFREYGGYPKDNLVYTGLARFDDLLVDNSDQRYILIMPTWRRYLVDDDSSKAMNFTESTFYRHYRSLLCSRELASFCQNHGLRVKFYLHAMFSSYRQLFTNITTEEVEIVDNSCSIHELLKHTSLLITDYSSVFFDAAYAGKPIIFYHFDYDEFRGKHFSEGYFSYENDGMGPVAYSEDELINEIRKMYKKDSFTISSIYAKRTKRFFPLHDTNNCLRIYNELKKI